MAGACQLRRYAVSLRVRCKGGALRLAAEPVHEAHGADAFAVAVGYRYTTVKTASPLDMSCGASALLWVKSRALEIGAIGRSGRA